jgi:hypothetical protein
MAMTRKRLVRPIVYGTLGLLVLVFCAHPYSRQMVFGPRVDDMPLAYWQDNFRTWCYLHEDGVDQAPIASKVFHWLGWSPRRRCPNLPSITAREYLPINKEDRMIILLSLADDADSGVRGMVAHELKYGYPPAESVPQLMRMLDDPTAWVRGMAAYALSFIEPRPEEAIPRLLELLEDPDLACRVSAACAAWSIGQGRHREVLPVLRLGFSDPDVDHRSGLACWIGHHMAECDDALTLLADCAASDPEFRVRVQAAMAFQKFGQRGVPGLAAMLRDPDPTVRHIAVSNLGLLGAQAKEALPALHVLLADSDQAVRQDAERALSQIDPERYPDRGGP